MSNIKKWGKEITTATIVRVIALLLVALFVTFFGWLQKAFIKDQVARIHTWLDSEHTITASGWSLASCFLIPIFLTLLLVFLLYLCLKYWRKTYRDKNTIIKILASWVIEHEDELSKEQLVYFGKIDCENKLEKGSAKKYLPIVVGKTDNLRIEHVNKYTAVVKSK